VVPCLFTLVPWLLQYAPREQPVAPAGATRLKVMTANVMILNDWYRPLIEQAREWKPDVLLIQEFTPDWADALDAEFGSDYPHRVLLPSALETFGLGVYSRLPIHNVSNGVAPARDNRPQQRLEVELRNGGAVALYHVHLRSPQTADTVADGRFAFAQLVDALAAEPLPFVVAGDFNFPETSPQHATLKRLGLREAHEQAGHGRGATWPARGPLTNIPGWRIDHVYFSEHFTALSCQTGRFTSSDHLPVFADLAIK
jgi:endonuclease/exonuclease/phosphatase (EEP) superfamily protein YafD